MELNPEQLLLVGLVASVVTQLLKLVFDRLGWAPGGAVKTIILFAIAAGLALVFFKDALLADPIGSLVGIVGAAVAIYEILLKDVVFPRVRLA